MRLILKNPRLADKYKALARKLPGVVDAALYDVAADMRADFQKTTASWDHNVTFNIVRAGKGYAVTTDDEVYGYVDLGTRPHTIEGNPFLAFQNSYVAKTQPRVIGSGGGGSGGETVYAQSVQHPGTRARLFSQTIGKKWEKEGPKRVQAALRTGLESVGL